MTSVRVFFERISHRLPLLLWLVDRRLYRLSSRAPATVSFVSQVERITDKRRKTKTERTYRFQTNGVNTSQKSLSVQRHCRGSVIFVVVPGTFRSHVDRTFDRSDNSQISIFKTCSQRYGEQLKQTVHEAAPHTCLWTRSHHYRVTVRRIEISDLGLPDLT